MPFALCSLGGACKTLGVETGWGDRVSQRSPMRVRPDWSGFPWFRPPAELSGTETPGTRRAPNWLAFRTGRGAEHGGRAHLSTVAPFQEGELI